MSRPAEFGAVRVALAAALAVIALVALPALAGAATVAVGVHVNPTAFYGPIGEQTVSFAADPAEGNQLVVTATADGADYVLHFDDAAAAIEPGEGCSGGGAPGVPADCRVRQPAEGTIVSCMKFGGCQFAPGTRWTLALEFTLGDGGSSLDASLPGIATGPIPMSVSPGAGNDTVTTGAGNDTIAASPGDDTIATGAGNDRFSGGPAPDGADDVALGFGENHVDYSERQGAVQYIVDDLADDGAPGEGDRLTGAIPFFSSGAGDDLISVPTTAILPLSLYTGPGNDLVLTGEGNDYVYPGEGDDAVYTRGGDDKVAEETAGSDFVSGGTGDDEITLAAGPDIVFGGPGDDEIELGAAPDRAVGGPGDDLIIGGEGDDRFSGGEGDDRLSGGGGIDLLSGGPGDDLILAGAIPGSIWTDGFLFSPGPIENVGDEVRCGGGDDRAGLDRFDRPASCERQIQLHRLDPLGVRPATSSVPARLRFTARTAGLITVSGPEVVRHSVSNQGKFASGRDWISLVPRGDAARRLEQTGRARVRIALRLRPDDGSPAAVRHQVVVIRRDTGGDSE